MRFYLDECINPEIAIRGQALGMDVTEWKTDRMRAATDEEQLRHAAKADRCIVTSGDA
jgi:predicted nuclease of predicted toxin-antitoxin system